MRIGGRPKVAPTGWAGRRHGTGRRRAMPGAAGRGVRRRATKGRPYGRGPAGGSKWGLPDNSPPCKGKCHGASHARAVTEGMYWVRWGGAAGRRGARGRAPTGAGRTSARVAGRRGRRPLQRRTGRRRGTTVCLPPRGRCRGASPASAVTEGVPADQREGQAPLRRGARRRRGTEDPFRHPACVRRRMPPPPAGEARRAVLNV